MTLSGKALRALRDGGLGGLLRKASLYLSRGVESRIEPWNERLAYRLDGERLCREYGHLLARNEIFRGMHAGRRCFVLGNGPSINGHDLSALAGELTFVTNAFCKHPTVDRWQPSYYFLSDPVYFNGSEASREDLREMARRTPESTYFVPHKAYEVLQREALLPEERTYYVALAGSLARDPAWKPDFTLVQPDVMTVAQFAIMGAMYMRCSPICLLGFDHDWLAHPNTHYTFYTGDGEEKHGRGYGEMLEVVLETWRGYDSIRKVAGAEGLTILNATPGSFLDIFERADFESLIGQGSAPRR